MTTAVFQHLEAILEGVERCGVVHVGAHKGQELDDYVAAGFPLVRLVEANPMLESHLVMVAERAAPVHVIVHPQAVGLPGVGVLHVTEWDERSSMLRPVDYPVTATRNVDVVSMSDVQDGCNVAVLDIQGGELDALRTGDLEALDVVIVECCDRPRYIGAAVRSEIEVFMSAAGWQQSGVFGGHSAPDLVDVVWRNPCS